MSRERREGNDEDKAVAEDAPRPMGLTPGKRSGTANAPNNPPPRVPGKRSLTQHFAPRAVRSAPPNPDEVATTAVANKGSGAALDGSDDDAERVAAGAVEQDHRRTVGLLVLVAVLRLGRGPGRACAVRLGRVRVRAAGDERRRERQRGDAH